MYAPAYSQMLQQLRNKLRQAATPQLLGLSSLLTLETYGAYFEGARLGKVFAVYVAPTARLQYIRVYYLCVIVGRQVSDHARPDESANLTQT